MREDLMQRLAALQQHVVGNDQTDSAFSTMPSISGHGTIPTKTVLSEEEVQKNMVEQEAAKKRYDFIVCFGTLYYSYTHTQSLSIYTHLVPCHDVPTTFTERKINQSLNITLISQRYHSICILVIYFYSLRERRLRAKKKREEQQAAEMARVLQEKDAMEEELEELKNNAATVGTTTVSPTVSPTLPCPSFVCFFVCCFFVFCLFFVCLFRCLS